MDDLRGSGRARVAAGVVAVLTVGAGLGVRAVAGGDVAKYAGDALYTVLVYALVLFAAPRLRPVAAAAVAAGLSWAVELFQLTGVPDDLGRRSAAARLVFGSTFNAPDLGWYLVGAASAALLHAGSVRLVRAGRALPSAVAKQGAPDRV
ncbi:ribosomal maturation YjgA family protein [Kitasatospora sp. NPDC003701]